MSVDDKSVDCRWIYRGYYMPALGYEFYFRVLKLVSHE